MSPRALLFFLFCEVAAISLLQPRLESRDKVIVGQYGAGLIVNISLPESEVESVVRDAAQNGIIRGTKEYNKDEYLKGAEDATSTDAFLTWTGGGKAFYKVRKHALDPRNFKDSGDSGTLAVRYVVQPEGASNTILHIDAIFVEEFRHTAHASNGSVEGSEYKNIQDHLDAIELMKKQAVEAARQAQLANKKFESAEPTLTADAAVVTPTGEISASASTATVADLAKDDASNDIAPRPGESIQEYAADLRRQVERRVKFPGAALKSAPYRSASTMEHLQSGSEILVVISTTYWLGIETHDGQHGWVARDQLEDLP